MCVNRRAVLGLLGKLLAAATALVSRPASAGTGGSEEAVQLTESMRAFGIEFAVSTGENAFPEWKRIKAEGRKSPVIVGDDKDLKEFIELLNHDDPNNAPAQILQRAGGLTFPDSLRSRRAIDERQLEELLAKSTGSNPDALRDAMAKIRVVGPDGKERPLSVEDYDDEKAMEPEVGEWPAEEVSSPDLTIVFDNDGKYKPKVYILLMPTADDTEIPAYLQLGGWNECPTAEHHVAALRSWKSRFGATIVAANADTINMLVARRPPDREEALAVAREQFLYCEDIVLQGTGTLAPLAAGLMTSDWWFFWWD
jgi:hypothetical protein